MGTLELPDDFKEFLTLLKSHGVKYLLIGGYAVGYHGHVRPTGDMDVWIIPDPQNVARVIDALCDFGFGETNLSPELFLGPKRIVRLGNAPLRLEIMTSISGVEFEDCYRDRITESIHGIEVDLIDLENLKRNKTASGRLKDLDDLDHLSGK